MTALVSFAALGPAGCTQHSTSTASPAAVSSSSPVSVPASSPAAAMPQASACARPSETFSPDGVTLGAQNMACEAADTCATEVIVVSEGCAVSSWRPAESEAVILSLSTAASFSPPMQAVIWAREVSGGWGIDALVREGDALIRVDGVELPESTRDDSTTCSWTFTLPSDPGGRENRILALERCEAWAPSEPGEPSFAPVEWDRRLTYAWDGSALTRELNSPIS